jgi:TrmH family RNA methyltransferase
MLSKKEIKMIRSLKQKKFRKQEQAFVVEGEKSVKELLSGDFEVRKILYTPRMSGTASTIHSTECVEVDEHTMQSLSSLSTAAGIMAVVNIPQREAGLSHKPELILALDRITDPGNLGTIIRTADWFGVTHIICSEDTVDLYNPKTIQSTMGSFIRVSVSYVPLAKTLTQLKSDYRILGLDMKGTDIGSAKSNVRKVVVTGSESNGISKGVYEIIDEYITIPVYQENPYRRPESLNASIATAIACYELTKN